MLRAFHSVINNKGLSRVSRSDALDITVKNMLVLQQEIETLRDNWRTISSEAKPEFFQFDMCC